MLVKERKVYFVTTNRNKFEEVKNLASEYSIEVEWLKVPKLEIQSADLSEIARYAAINSYMLYRVPIVVEDTGLFIKSLNGFPGPYSNYVYNTIGLEGILKLMKDIDDRSAYFITYVAFVNSPDLVLFR
ncbi:MAG: non-canonical purine NTP pyrophosphatase, partial [Sulfolobaceae archaeon]